MFGDPRLPERFWKKFVVDDDGCWIWTADKVNGYGRFRLEPRGKNYYVHRLVYETLVRPIVEGLVLDHLCRQRACGNPTHIEPVTQKENIARSPIHVGAHTHCPKGHPYDEINTAKTEGRRACIVCRREAKRARDEAERQRRRMDGSYRLPAAERTHCPRGHEYDKINTIVTVTPSGNPGRACRTCKNERRRARAQNSRSVRPSRP